MLPSFYNSALYTAVTGREKYLPSCQLGLGPDFAVVRVVYMCSSLLNLAVESRNFSQAEKQIAVITG